MESYPFETILKQWNITFKQVHPAMILSGSPQRSLYRIVVEDEHGKFFILEQISKNKLHHKQLIAQVLLFLSDHNLEKIHPYLVNRQNQCISRVHDDFWQVQPYINGIELSRPSYVFDSWRGRSAADFLIQLWSTSDPISSEFALPLFSLKEYVVDMALKMRQFNDKEYHQIKPFLDYLSKDFFLRYDLIPLRFCHGDYHPLNILWGKRSIQSVIDWEFMGIKPEIYDMANMLGCVGIEDPDGLLDGFVLNFLRRIKQEDIISEIGFELLFDCIIALRFAWLAEWFRATDREMIGLEIDFLTILYENASVIRKSWQSYLSSDINDIDVGSLSVDR